MLSAEMISLGQLRAVAFSQFSLGDLYCICIQKMLRFVPWRKSVKIFSALKELKI